jgi:hypothetical protein
MKRLAKVFDSSSYRITDRVRINAFKRLEQPAFEIWSALYRDMEKETKKLQDQIAKTAQVLRHNIEVAEEGHSKALLAFTLVTIIFLPLSFVASLFGMNTADMRNLQNTQSLFWAVALPLTAIIGGLSLLVAYGGTQIGERFDDLRESIRQGRSKTRKEKPSPKSKSRKRDEEEVDDRGRKLPSASSTLKRRKTAKNTFVMPTKLSKRSSEKIPSATRVKVQAAYRNKSQTREYQTSRAVPGGNRQQNVVKVSPNSSPESSDRVRVRAKRVVGIKEMFY